MAWGDDYYSAPPSQDQFGKFSLKKLANAALAVTAVVYPPAAPVIAAGAAIKSATKKDKKAPVVEAPVAPVQTSVFNAFGPQYHDMVMVGSAVAGSLLLAKLMSGKK